LGDFIKIIKISQNYNTPPKNKNKNPKFSQFLYRKMAKICQKTIY